MFFVWSALLWRGRSVITTAGFDTATMHGMTSTDDDAAIRRSYVRVMVIWACTLAALYGFQQYFS